MSALEGERRALLIHMLAALAYRTQKAVRGASEDFSDYEPGNGARTPNQLLCHMTSVLGYACTFFTGGTYRPEPLPTLEHEIIRFHGILDELAEHLGGESPFLNEMTAERMLQGPLSDAMTHAGQLGLMRRLYGDPVPPENFIFAEITAENLSPDQAQPARPDPDWPEALKETGSALHFRERLSE